MRIINAHLKDPDLTLRELSEMVGFESKWPAQRILAGFYAGQIERETKDEKYRALETAMALAAAEEARRLAKLPLIYLMEPSNRSARRWRGEALRKSSKGHSEIGGPMTETRIPATTR